jgi:cyclic beta-1,2-glucan synthetase
VKSFWTHTLNCIQIETPDSSVDVLANNWLLYQVLSSRIWGRSGFYQSSGAFGFRDQLQDSIAVSAALPHILKQQIITCCEHQYEKGDVCHWWHPISNRGVRTTFSDDYLWLPMAVAYYVETTGDKSILDIDCKFVTGRELNVGEESVYDLIRVSDASATVYEHCKKSIKYGLKYGVHGLPLMGCGDWNDGMNMVGIHGKGESVWLAFFLYYVMDRFTTIVSEIQNDKKFIELCHEHMEQLKLKIDENAWDGEWYRRAYFDNGEPLGSKQCDECQIDSLPQSWSVIASATRKERALQGMENAYKRLVRKDLKLIQLFDPPFEKSRLNPGYIKGYAPGVRENGGQYTHAAIWMVWAYSKLQEVQRTWELFDLLNPINHTRTRQDLDQYKVEPYVVAADVYTLKGHEGHGGWTWYTGSAGWMYRLIIEQLIGVYKNGDCLVFNPCPRKEWKEYKVHYRFGKSMYHITFVKEKEGAEKVVPVKVTLDDQVTIYQDRLLMSDDGKEHRVTVHLKSKN